MYTGHWPLAPARVGSGAGYGRPYSEVVGAALAQYSLSTLDTVAGPSRRRRAAAAAAV